MLGRQSCETSVEQAKLLVAGSGPKPFTLTYVNGHSASHDDSNLQPLEILALTRCVEHERVGFIIWGVKAVSTASPSIVSSRIIGSGMFGYVYLAREVDYDRAYSLLQRIVDFFLGACVAVYER